MVKNILSFVAAVTLVTSVIAGGDDRDRGPVESLDSLGSKVSNKGAEKLKLSVGGKSVSINAHIICQSKLGFSESNITIFKKAQSSGYLYNTGPVEEFGTVFSPERWDQYFACVDEHGG